MKRGSWLVILIFYFISFFSCLFKNTISTIKGVSFICAIDVDNLRCPFRIILSTVANYSFSHNVRNNLVSSFNSRVTHFKSWDISCMNIIEKLRTFFLTPKYTFGTKNAQKACSGAPSNWVLFQKMRWKYMKMRSFNLSTLKDIVEDCVVSVWRPQMTF